jgi:hypothetical protein
MEPSESICRSSGSTQSGATSSPQRVCFCERPMIVRTAQTDKNYGRRFVGCENWKASPVVAIL